MDPSWKYFLIDSFVILFWNTSMMPLEYTNNNISCSFLAANRNCIECNQVCSYKVAFNRPTTKLNAGKFQIWWQKFIRVIPCQLTQRLQLDHLRFEWTFCHVYIYINDGYMQNFSSKLRLLMILWSILHRWGRTIFALITPASHFGAFLYANIFCYFAGMELKPSIITNWHLGSVNLNSFIVYLCYL